MFHIIFASHGKTSYLKIASIKLYYRITHLCTITGHVSSLAIISPPNHSYYEIITPTSLEILHKISITFSPNFPPQLNQLAQPTYPTYDKKYIMSNYKRVKTVLNSRTKYVCIKCDKEYSSEYALRLHNRVKHKTETRNEYSSFFVRFVMITF